MFIVKRNGRPAIKSLERQWKKCFFDTLLEAQVYAARWLGRDAPSHPIYVGETYHYGKHDYISIESFDPKPPVPKKRTYREITGWEDEMK